MESSQRPTSANDLGAEIRKGLELLRGGDAEGCLGVLRPHLDQHADSPDLCLAVAMASAQRGSVEEALPWAERAAALAPDRPNIHHNLGVLCERAGREEDARQAYARVVQMKPDHAAAKKALARLEQEDAASGASGKCPKCGALNAPGYVTCGMCQAPAQETPAPEPPQEQASPPSPPTVPDYGEPVSEELPPEEEAKLLRRSYVLVGGALAIAFGAEAIRIGVTVAEGGGSAALAIIGNLAAEFAVPFVVAWVVYNMQTTEPQPRILRACAWVGAGIVFADFLRGALIWPVFGIVLMFIPFSGLILSIILYYLAAMFATDKCLRVRMDQSYPIAAAITVGTFIVGLVVGLGLAAAGIAISATGG